MRIEHAGVGDDGARGAHFGVERVEGVEGGGGGEVVDAAVFTVARAEEASDCVCEDWYAGEGAIRASDALIAR